MSAQDKVFYEKIEGIFDRKARPCVMGILNITPDSFHDGGNYLLEKNWLGQVEVMISEGAGIIDVGAYSSRPNAIHISEQEEENRLLKAVRSVRKHFPECLISIDTFRSRLAEKAIEAGGNIINDISGGELDKNMFTTVARMEVPYILMHMQGTPQNMQINPQYDHVVKDVYSFFEKKLRELDKLGHKKVILDPGFGFGKSVEHNKELLLNLDAFSVFGQPILVGLSRKSFVNKLLNVNQLDTLRSTIELNKIALKNGAHILRVHDVKEAYQIIH